MEEKIVKANPLKDDPCFKLFKEYLKEMTKALNRIAEELAAINERHRARDEDEAY